MPRSVFGGSGRPASPSRTDLGALAPGGFCTMPFLKGGRTVYGQALGILMLDTRFPRPPGDVGNATTWPFPTQYRIVKGADPSRIMGREPDPTLLEPCLKPAHDIEAHGDHAITTSCGFLAVFKRELAAAVSVPVQTSALLQ